MQVNDCGFRLRAAQIPRAVIRSSMVMTLSSALIDDEYLLPLGSIDRARARAHGRVD